MAAEKTIAVCRHVASGKYKATTIVMHVAIPGMTRAEDLNTETQLCAMCSGHLGGFLTMLENSGGMNELLNERDAVRRKLEQR